MQGMIWSNEGNTQKYIESLTNQELPIVKSREYHAFDRRLVFFPKTMKIEKRISIECQSVRKSIVNYNCS